MMKFITLAINYLYDTSWVSTLKRLIKIVVNLFCFFLGSESGALSNSKNWKRITPHSLKSPFYVQGDIGFFYYKKKRYGQFYIAVNTYTKRIFCIPLRNTKSASLIEAIGAMLKEKEFKRTKTLLFDGESGLRSQKVQNIIWQKHGLKIHAEPTYKRNQAERSIREIKLRMAILLDLKGNLCPAAGCVTRD